MPRSTSAARRWGRRLLLLVAALVTVVLLLVGAALVWVNSEPGKRWLVGLARDRLPGLQVEEITGFLPWRTRIHGIVIDDIHGHPVITARALDVRVRLVSLLRHRIVLPELGLYDLHASIAPEPDGVLNVYRLQPPGPPRKQQPLRWRIDVERLVVERARLAYANQRGPVLAAGTTLTGSLAAGNGPISLAVDLEPVTVGLAPYDVTVSAAGPVTYGNTIRADLAGRIASATAQGPWRLSASGTPAALTAQLHASAGAAGRLDAYLAGSAGGLARPYIAQVSVESLDPAALVPSMPPGNLTATLAVHGAGRPLTAGSRLSADARVAPSRVATLQIETARLAGATHGPAWEVTSASGHGPGWAVRGSGSGIGRALTASLEARARGVEVPLRSGRVRATGRTTVSVARAADGLIGIDGSLKIADASYGEYAVSGVAARARLGGYPVRPTGSITVAARRIVSPRVVLGHLAGTAAISPRWADVRGRVRLRSVASRPVRLLAKVPLASGRRGVSLDRAAPLFARLEVSGVSAPALAALGGSRAVSAGEIAARLELTGTATAPELGGHVSLAGGRIASKPDFEGDAGLTLVAALGPAPALASAATRRSPAPGASRAARTVPASATSPAPAASLTARPVRGRVRLEARVTRDAGNASRPVAGLLADASLSGTAGAPAATIDAVLRDASRGRRPFGSVELRSRIDRTARATTVAAALATRGQEVASLRLVRPSAGAASTRLTRGTLLVQAPDLSTVLPRWIPVSGSLAGMVSLDRLGPTPRGRAVIDAGELRIQRRLVGDVHVDGRLHGGGGLLQLAIEQGTGSLGGTISLAGEELEGDLSARNLDLMPLRPVLETAKRIAGTLDGKLRFTGRLERGPQGVRLVAIDRAEIDEGRIGLVAAAPRPRTSTGQEPKAAKVKPEEVVQKHREARGKLALTLRRLEVRHTELDLVDATDERRPVLRVHSIAATLENYANRPSLAKGRPAVFAMSAEVERTGELSAFATLDPTEATPTLAGQANLEVALTDLRDFVAAKSGIQTVGGWFSAFLQFKVVDGRVSGGIKPLVIEAEVAPAHETLLSRIETLAAGLGLAIFSGGPPGRSAVAAVVPIEGQLGQTDVQIVPAVLGIIHNAFVVGLASGFSYLPPITAEQRQSLASQAIEALTRSRPPRAQPPARGGG